MRLATQATMLASVRIGPHIVAVGDRGVALLSARLAPTRCGAVVEANADRLDDWRR